MLVQWLHNRKGKRLILFFLGWGMDSTVVKGMEAESHDVLCCHSYHESGEVDFGPIISGYEEILIIGWSMGVYEANSRCGYLSKKNIVGIAINGTLMPIHEKFGIPPEWYEKTMENFGPSVVEKFYLRMCGNREIYREFCAKRPRRSLASLGAELEYFFEKGKNPRENRLFHYAVIGLKDKIFPGINQIQFWAGTACTQRHLETLTHYPFSSVKSWDDFVDLVRE